MSVEVIGPVNESSRGNQVLVKHGADHFVVSSTVVLGTPETLVFRANDKGEIVDWLEVAGGKLMSREEAIADLESGARDLA